MSHRQFSEHGFAVIEDVLDGAECDRLSTRLQSLGRPGTRDLLQHDWCGALASRIRSSPALAGLVPATHVAVQCSCFEKSTATNWLVATHQDLAVPVGARIEHPDLSGWSRKQGALYVQPPLEVLRDLVAIRLHVDACAEADGPLRVVPGSHAHGRIAAGEIAALRAARPEVVCAAPRGSVLAMRPLLLHASSRASGTSMRRVLHFLFGPPSLPHGLQWRQAV
ncbi:phytanoyl-CoA dioxygenase [Lysobacter maris]|uniref:Phytanoyl-CoA dioxygenase n=1 Tax=Marilutibacter maris TaxID=1605891 RepID=A0A508AIZ0_9GAMM|nr:phytanoyl-CoA dioxygenase family protein [Lysobacter maris]KAB8180051.1 phytanoyl-CoA dioxygenase [Lysobacter maris]